MQTAQCWKYQFNLINECECTLNGLIFIIQSGFYSPVVSLVTEEIHPVQLTTPSISVRILFIQKDKYVVLNMLHVTVCNAIMWWWSVCEMGFSSIKTAQGQQTEGLQMPLSRGYIIGFKHPETQSDGATQRKPYRMGYESFWRNPSGAKLLSCSFLQGHMHGYEQKLSQVSSCELVNVWHVISASFGGLAGVNQTLSSSVTATWMACGITDMTCYHTRMQWNA